MTKERLDAAESVWFQRDLEERKRRVYEKKYPELKGRRFVPVATEYNPGVEAIVFRQWDQAGIAQIVSNYATDFPRVEVKAQEKTAKVKTLGASFGYSLQDIRRARMQGTSLEQRKANAARLAILRKDEQILALGEPSHGLVGLLNQPNVPLVSAIDVGAGKTRWDDKTDDEIIDDLNLFAKTIQANTNSIESPNTLLLPPSCLIAATQKRLNNSQTTLMRWWLESQSWIQDVDAWHFLETAGVGGTRRAMAYRRDEEYLEHPVPVDVNMPVEGQWEGMEYSQPMEARVGGVIMHYPLSAVYMDNL